MNTQDTCINIHTYLWHHLSEYLGRNKNKCLVVLWATSNLVPCKQLCCCPRCWFSAADWDCFTETKHLDHPPITVLLKTNRLFDLLHYVFPLTKISIVDTKSSFCHNINDISRFYWVMIIFFLDGMSLASKGSYFERHRFSFQPNLMRILNT